MPLVSSKLIRSWLDPQTGEIDPLKLFHMRAVDRLQNDQAIRERLRGDGMPWGAMNKVMEECIPEGITSDIQNLAYQEVKHAMDGAFGQQGEGWEAFQNQQTGKKWVHVLT